MSDRPPIFGQKAFSGAFSNPFGSGFSSKGGFDPKLFGDLRLDLDAFRDASASAWLDQSGNENNVTQGVTANQPILTTDGINGKPSLDFDGTNDYMFSATSRTSLNITSSFSFYVACIVDSAMINPNFIAKNINAGYRVRIGVADKLTTIVADAGGFQTDSSVDVVTIGIPVILEAHFTVGGSILMTMNGVSLGTPPVNTLVGITSNTAALFVGQNGVNSEFYNGDIGRILLYATLPSTADRNNIIRGLATQFGISVGLVT